MTTAQAVHGRGRAVSRPRRRPPPQRVEISSRSARCSQLLVFAALVALAILSLGTLLSIFLAAVLALGLDPPVSALVQRGWKRGRASLVIFAALFVAVFVLVLVTRRAGVGPDRRVRPRSCRPTGTS